MSHDLAKGIRYNSFTALGRILMQPVSFDSELSYLSNDTNHQGIKADFVELFKTESYRARTGGMGRCTPVRIRWFYQKTRMRIIKLILIFDIIKLIKKIIITRFQ